MGVEQNTNIVCTFEYHPDSSISDIYCGGEIATHVDSKISRLLVFDFIIYFGYRGKNLRYSQVARWSIAREIAPLSG